MRHVIKKNRGLFLPLPLFTPPQAKVGPARDRPLAPSVGPELYVRTRGLSRPSIASGLTRASGSPCVDGGQLPALVCRRLQHTMAVTRQIPLGAAERVPDACAWTESDPRGPIRTVGSAPPPTGHVNWPCVEAAAHAYRQGAHHADARDAPNAAASTAHVSTDLSG